MKRATNILWVIVLLTSSVTAFAQIENFTLTNAVDNSEVSLSSFANKKAVAVIFTSNYCPFSKLYEARIKAMAVKYTDVQFLLVNSNSSKRSSYDTVEEMAKRAVANNYSFPYLADKDQVVSSNFGATKTPESFVLKSDGSQFSIVYQGAIDDNPQIAEDVSRHYLQDALNATLKGAKPTVVNTRPTGCIIKR